MSVIHFADLRGRRYAIPEDVLVRHEVHGPLPEGERLTGLEVEPEGAAGSGGPGGIRPGGAGAGGPAPVYEWRVQPGEGGLEYVVTRADAPAGPRQVFSGAGVTVVVDGGEVRIQAGPSAPDRGAGGGEGA
uniref:Uncharacterized protein n=1 Tax=uncultured bacterium esnapd22 TaxID=1366604 RepID=S5TLM5_9BACT|nr:hypothetical protein [uncultured bacterium esnapd22]